MFTVQNHFVRTNNSCITNQSLLSLRAFTRLVQTFSTSHKEFSAAADVVRRYILCLPSDATDQSPVEVLKKKMFSSKQQFLPLLTSSSKSKGKLNTSCDLFSVHFSRSCSTFFLRIYFVSVRGTPAHVWMF